MADEWSDPWVVGLGSFLNAIGDGLLKWMELQWQSKFDAAENARERAHELVKLRVEQTHKWRMDQALRTAQREERTHKADEAALDRQAKADEAAAERDFKTTQAGLDRDQARWVVGQERDEAAAVRGAAAAKEDADRQLEYHRIDTADANVDADRVEGARQADQLAVTGAINKAFEAGAPPELIYDMYVTAGLLSPNSEHRTIIEQSGKKLADAHARAEAEAAGKGFLDVRADLEVYTNELAQRVPDNKYFKITTEVNPKTGERFEVVTPSYQDPDSPYYQNAQKWYKDRDAELYHERVIYLQNRAATDLQGTPLVNNERFFDLMLGSTSEAYAATRGSSATPADVVAAAGQYLTESDSPEAQEAGTTLSNNAAAIGEEVAAADATASGATTQTVRGKTVSAPPATIDVGGWISEQYETVASVLNPEVKVTTTGGATRRAARAARTAPAAEADPVATPEPTAAAGATTIRRASRAARGTPEPAIATPLAQQAAADPAAGTATSTRRAARAARTADTAAPAPAEIITDPDRGLDKPAGAGTKVFPNATMFRGERTYPPEPRMERGAELGWGELREGETPPPPAGDGWLNNFLRRGSMGRYSPPAGTAPAAQPPPQVNLGTHPASEMPELDSLFDVPLEEETIDPTMARNPAGWRYGRFRSQGRRV